MFASWKKSYDQYRQHIQKQRHYFANKDPSSQGYGFSCGHVWMWELDCEEGWAPKNWCFWTVLLEKTLESPLDCKEIQPVHSEGDQPWDFFGGNDGEAETPVLWPSDAKSWLIRKDFILGGAPKLQQMKIRDITLPTKVRLVKAMVFPGVMYGCKSWTIKKAEHQRIDAFELWCERRLLGVPWTARRSNLNQS